MKKIVSLFYLTLLLSSTDSISATCIAVTGLYSAPGTWSCGRIPANGDIVNIPAGVTVTVDMTTSLLNNVQFYVYGTLDFQNAQKIKLDCNSSVTVFAGGALTGGNGGSKIEYCGDPNAWQGPGPDAGPLQFGPSPTPVELISFTACYMADVENVKLDWSTASEINNDYFTVEYSYDATLFEEAEKIDGAGNSFFTLDYTCFDEKRFNEGVIYYRLKQTDFDGKFAYSSIQAVNISDKPYLIYPNPSFSGEFTIQIANADITVFNYLGQVVILDKVNGKKKFNLDNSGMYMLRMNTGSKIYSVGIINTEK